MNLAMRCSLSAVFTGVATSYFVTAGAITMARRPLPLPVLIQEGPKAEVQGHPGTPLALEEGDPQRRGAVGAGALEDVGLVKKEQEALRSRLDVLMKVMLGVEEAEKGDVRRLDSLEVKLTETQKVLQETKDALDAAQGRVTKLEAALKSASDASQKSAQNAKKMVKMYSTMTPDKAAKIMLELSNAEAADVLSKMKETEVAGILALFPPKRAALISARLSGNKGGTP